MKRPRAYTADERSNAVTALRGLADELDRPDAGRTQQLLEALMDPGYSSTASGAGVPGGGGGSGDTIVEAKASRPDKVAGDAIELVLRLRRLLRDAYKVRDGLTDLRSDRPVALCPEGHVLERTAGGGKRCQHIDPDTGARCGSAQVVRRCDNCNRVVAPGQKRRRSIALDLGGQELQECDRCWKYRERNHRSWGDATRLTPGVLGAYPTDEEPWAGTG